jgi:hypothetical protein
VDNKGCKLISVEGYACRTDEFGSYSGDLLILLLRAFVVSFQSQASTERSLRNHYSALFIAHMKLYTTRTNMKNI